MKIVGPALGAVIKTVIDNLRDQMKKRRTEKAKKVKVVLYGPDGNEIKWEEEQ